MDASHPKGHPEAEAPSTHPGSTGSTQHPAALTGSGVRGCPWCDSESSGRCWQQLPGGFPHHQSTAGGELGGEGTSGWDHPQILAQGQESSLRFGGCRAPGIPGRGVGTLDVQAVAEGGIPCSVGGRAGVEASVCQLGLSQVEGP